MNSNLANHSVKQFFRCSSGSWRSVFKWCSTMSSPSKYASLPKVCSISCVCVCGQDKLVQKKNTGLVLFSLCGQCGF